MKTPKSQSDEPVSFTELHNITGTTYNPQGYMYIDGSGTSTTATTNEWANTNITQWMDSSTTTNNLASWGLYNFAVLKQYNEAVSVVIYPFDKPRENMFDFKLKMPAFNFKGGVHKRDMYFDLKNLFRFFMQVDEEVNLELQDCLWADITRKFPRFSNVPLIVGLSNTMDIIEVPYFGRTISVRSREETNPSHQLHHNLVEMDKIIYNEMKKDFDDDWS